MIIDLMIVNAFSKEQSGGNPAGIVFNADDLTTQQKQAIAAKAGLSETAFVSSSIVADYKLDFFTPVKQIPHCGHATVAVFSLLKQQGLISSDQSSKETIDGCRNIIFKNDAAYLEQRSPAFQAPEEDNQTILAAVGLDEFAMLPGKPPMIVNTGNSFLILPIRDEISLKKAVADHTIISELSAKYGLVGWYLFARDSNTYDATTRMFAPYYGINEEAATGMAAGPLAAYLYDIVGVKKSSFKIEQGKFMQPASPSRIHVDLMIEGEIISSLYAGGTAFLSAEKRIEI